MSVRCLSVERTYWLLTCRLVGPSSSDVVIRPRTLICDPAPKTIPFWLMTRTAPSAFIEPSICDGAGALDGSRRPVNGSSRSDEHTSELQSLMRNSYAVLCLQKKKPKTRQQ